MFALGSSNEAGEPPPRSGPEPRSVADPARVEAMRASRARHPSGRSGRSVVKPEGAQTMLSAVDAVLHGDAAPVDPVIVVVVDGPTGDGER